VLTPGYVGLVLLVALVVVITVLCFSGAAFQDLVVSLGSLCRLSFWDYVGLAALFGRYFDWPLLKDALCHCAQ
jgi:hypothetical protein